MPSPEVSSSILWVAANLGVGAAVAIILLIWGFICIRELTREIADLSHSINLMLLASQLFPPIVQEQAEELKQRIEARMARRKQVKR